MTVPQLAPSRGSFASQGIALSYEEWGDGNAGHWPHHERLDEFLGELLPFLNEKE